MTDLDIKKVLEQEPEFLQYCKDVLFISFSATNIAIFEFIFSMWQIGNNAEQTSQVLNGFVKPFGDEQ